MAKLAVLGASDARRGKRLKAGRRLVAGQEGEQRGVAAASVPVGQG